MSLQNQWHHALGLHMLELGEVPVLRGKVDKNLPCLNQNLFLIDNCWHKQKKNASNIFFLKIQTILKGEPHAQE